MIGYEIEDGRLITTGRRICKPFEYVQGLALIVEQVLEHVVVAQIVVVGLVLGLVAYQLQTRVYAVDVLEWENEKGPQVHVDVVLGVLYELGKVDCAYEIVEQGERLVDAV